MDSKFPLFIGLLCMIILTGCEENAGTPTETDSSTDTEAEPEITGIDPDEGKAGTIVTISGKAFSTDASENRVAFNGVEAEVKEASESELTTEVPDEAETGTIEVTVHEVTATGPTFTITGEDPNPEVQSYNVEGRVVDEGTGAGIEDIEISLSGDHESVYTDGNGNWSATDLKGPVAVTVEDPDWEFPIRTRLVLGAADNVDFKANNNYSDPDIYTGVAYQFREDCSQGTYCEKPYSIWTMTPGGSQKEQLTDSTGSDHNPAWSPDGQQIAFDSDRNTDSDANRIWIMDKDGSEMTDTEVEGMQPAWSPEGDEILYVREGDIWMMDLYGDQREIFASPEYAGSPEWSPEGSKIVFELTDNSSSGTHIWAMEADGGNATPLTEENSPNRSPAWKPSGDQIMYASGGPATVSRLKVMDVDGSNIDSQDWPDHSQLHPVWSPNGEEILYVYRRMIPISERIHWNPAEGDAWMPTAPDEPYKDEEFWATSPAWAPK